MATLLVSHSQPLRMVQFHTFAIISNNPFSSFPFSTFPSCLLLKTDLRHVASICIMINTEEKERNLNNKKGIQNSNE